MSVFIKNINGRNLIEFDSGLFDTWCVYLTKDGQARFAPRDAEYFARLKELAAVHGSKRIYDDFVSIYNLTDATISTYVLDFISQLAEAYIPDAEEIEVLFTILYAGMVAEENKKNAILKKRIKRLGIHQILIEGLDADYAANFSKGKKVWQLIPLMTEFGF